MRSRGRPIILAFAVVLFLPAAEWCLPGQAKQQKTPEAVQVAVRGDLVISSLDVERLGFGADGSHRVRLDVKVGFSSAVRTASSGPFKIRAEYRDGLGVYRLLGEAGVAGMSVGAAAAVTPTETRSFETAVPHGTTRTFRVTVDPTGMVSETHELNNQATESYAAIGCRGVDLVLTQVEVERTTGGAVVHVWVRNRCLDTCDGEVSYSIDPRECIPGELGVTQPIGRRFEGETLYGPLGNAVAPGRAGAEIIYTVSIDINGVGCPDSDLTNNSSRVVLPASETRRVFHLR
jgi:hypothetical protein